MNYRKFKNHFVSEISLGTAGLADSHYGVFHTASQYNAEQIIEYAHNRGISLVDTAPAYGTEDAVGKVARRHPYLLVATKVAPGSLGSMLRSAWESRKKIGRKIFLLQVHNYDYENTACVNTSKYYVLSAILKATGIIRYFGVSTYGFLSPYDNYIGCADSIQYPHNILYAAAIPHEKLEFGKAAKIVRSCFLRGALTAKIKDFPDSLQELKAGIEFIMRENKFDSYDELEYYALRYCLSDYSVSTVLIGATTKHEIDKAIEYTDAKSEHCSFQIPILSPSMLDPREWSVQQ